MAPDLLPCPFCAEPIQPTAKKCRHCNEWLPDGWQSGDVVPRRPLEVTGTGGATMTPAPPPPVQTIELTGKKWKGMTVVAWAMIALGVILLLGGSWGWGLVLILVGVITKWVASAGAWWYHK